MPEPKTPVRQKKDRRGDPENLVTPLASSLGETVEAVVALQKRIVDLEAALAHERNEREADALMTGQLLARIATLESELRVAQDVANVLDEELRASEK